MDSVVAGALGSLVTVVFGALGGLVARVIWVRHQAKMESRKAENELRLANEKSALDQWRELHGIQQKQLERQQRQIARQEELIAELFEADTECQVQLAHLYGFAERLHDFLSRCADSLSKHGEDVGEIPPLPPMPKRKDRRTEFSIRQSAQESATLVATTDKIRERPTPDAPEP